MPSFKPSSHLSISFPCPLKMTLSQTYASAFLFLPNSRLRYLIMCFKYLVINLFSVFLVFDWKFHVSRDTVLFISALGGTRAKLNKHLLKIWLTGPGKSPHCVVWCHFWLWPSTSTGSSILGTAILQPSHPFHTAPLQPSTLSYFLCPPFPKGQILLFIFQKKLKQLNDESHGFRPSPVSKPPGPLPVLSAFLWTHPLLHPQEQDLCTVWSSTSLSLSFLLLLNLSAAFYCTLLIFLLPPWPLLSVSFGNLHFLLGNPNHIIHLLMTPKSLSPTLNSLNFNMWKTCQYLGSTLSQRELFVHWPQPITHTALPLCSLAQWKVTYHPVSQARNLELYLTPFSLPHKFIYMSCLMNYTC